MCLLGQFFNYLVQIFSARLSCTIQILMLFSKRSLENVAFLYFVESDVFKHLFVQISCLCHWSAYANAGIVVGVASMAQAAPNTKKKWSAANADENP